MRRAIACMTAILIAASPALAQEDDVRRIESDADFATTLDRLTSAIEDAGVTVFAAVDHGQGARDVGADIGDSTVVIFGNPAAGTPVMVRDRLAGLMLPLKILVYEDEAGKVWVAHEDIADRLDDLDGIDDDAEIAPLVNALSRFSSAAAGQ